MSFKSFLSLSLEIAPKNIYYVAVPFSWRTAVSLSFTPGLVHSIIWAVWTPLYGWLIQYVWLFAIAVRCLLPYSCVHTATACPAFDRISKTVLAFLFKMLLTSCLVVLHFSISQSFWRCLCWRYRFFENRSLVAFQSVLNDAPAILSVTHFWTTCFVPARGWGPLRMVAQFPAVGNQSGVRSFVEFWNTGQDSCREIEWR